MKRYRVRRFRFDSRANILQFEIKPHFDDAVKHSLQLAQKRMKDSIANQYGSDSLDQKLENLIAIGATPPSIIWQHDEFFADLRDSFIIGAYFTAFAGACVLGERILNSLIVELRSYYTGSDVSNDIFTKKSWQNWLTPIEALVTWNVFFPGVADAYKALYKLRRHAIHFVAGTRQRDVRTLALSATGNLHTIINIQFSAFFNSPMFIEGTEGAAFIKHQFEETPFFKVIYLPHCVKVSPYHTINDKSQIIDREVPDRPISDEEFAKLYATPATPGLSSQ